MYFPQVPIAEETPVYELCMNRSEMRGADISFRLQRLVYSVNLSTIRVDIASMQNRLCRYIKI